MEKEEYLLQKRALELILSYRDYYGTYHHHKERMAFGGTALYLGGATLAILQISSGHLKSLILPLILITIIAGVFVWWQFRRREDAAEIVLACTKLATKWTCEKPSEDQLKPTLCKYNNLVLPMALVTGLENIRDNRAWCRGPRFSEFLAYIAGLLWPLMLLTVRYLFR